MPKSHAYIGVEPQVRLHEQSWHRRVHRLFPKTSHYWLGPKYENFPDEQRRKSDTISHDLDRMIGSAL
jgi:hypothetical protein